MTAITSTIAGIRQQRAEPGSPAQPALDEFEKPFDPNQSVVLFECNIDVAEMLEELLIVAGVVALTVEFPENPRLAFRVAQVLVETGKEARARQLLLQAQRQKVIYLDWTCDHCGDVNPQDFEICWKCRRPSRHCERLPSQVDPE